MALTPAPVEYEIAAATRAGASRQHRFASDEPLRPGSILRLEGRWWIVESLDESVEPPRAQAQPARYRLRLRYPDGREEAGVFRRYRSGAPGVGHAFTTLEDGAPISWSVVDESLAHDEQGEPYLDLVAERDFAELEELPDHELEHALASSEDAPPEGVTATLARAEAAGLSVELVALEPGELPDWPEAGRDIDALELEVIEDDLFELCGVDVDRDPREQWLGTVKERLHADLEAFRADVEGEHDQIEEWELLDGRVFAAVGSVDDESDPRSGYGWMCRLVDAGALRAAGLRRVKKAEL